MNISDVRDAFEEIGFILPKEFFLEEREGSFRIASKKLMNVKIKGYRGVSVYSKKLSHGFILSFGHMAKKKIRLDYEQALIFCEGKNFEIDKSEGKYVVVFDEFVLGLCEVKKGVCHSLVPLGFRRKINKE